MRKRLFMIVVVIASVVGSLAVFMPSADAKTKKPGSSQKASQTVVEQYAAAAATAVPYPLADMLRGAWLERRLLVENLKRQNDPKRLAYVTLLNTQGQPIIQFSIQGMVFSLNSQMTTEDTVKDYNTRNGVDVAVTKSPGDNATWGPEPDGVGFFTTEGVEVKWNGLYLESDSPLNITTKPVIVYDASTAKPSVSGGGVGSKAGGGGISTAAAAGGTP
jgi:hypothetical protein